MPLQKVTITCADNISLTGTYYPVKEKPTAAILIAPATGIRRHFYASFAKHLVLHGYAVLTFDNRGIGDSLDGSLKGNPASIVDWGTLDLPAALKHLQTLVSNTTYHLIGHSAGGQLIGLMPNAHELSSVFNIACSSGQLRNMKFPFRWKAKFFMNWYIPFNNFLFGYTKAHLVGMGQPLPKKVAQQWADWCNGQGYVKTAFGKEVQQHWYDTLQVTSYWINAIDDDIANNANVADMISVFDKLPTTTKTLTPQDYNLKEIGHMKFFSKKSSVLWSLALDWFSKKL